jgi:Protein tyrosine and serine/threonine kinase
MMVSTPPALLLGLLFVSCASAQDMYVDTNSGTATDTLPCSQGSPCKTIAFAFASAASGATIWLAEGTVDGRVAGNNAIGGNFRTSDVTVACVTPGDPSRCVWDGFDTLRFLVNTPTAGASMGHIVTLRDLTVRRGFRSGPSGALRVKDSRLLAINCVFERNSVSNGQQGGVLYQDGAKSRTSSRFEGCVFRDNKAGGNGGSAIGGAIRIADNTDLELIRTTFERNSADDHGGAVFVGAGTNVVTIEHCVFKDNTAERGGALSIGNSAGSDLLLNVTFGHFEGNRGVGNGGNERGGAIAIGGGVAGSGVFHSTFVNNTLPGATLSNTNAGGGALATLARGRPIAIENCTFARNDAGGARGGAVFVQFSSAVRVTDCAFAENTAREGGALFFSTSTRDVVATGNTFDKNSATLGGAVWINGRTKMELRDTALLSDNPASNANSGAIHYAGDAAGTTLVVDGLAAAAPSTPQDFFASDGGSAPVIQFDGTNSLYRASLTAATQATLLASGTLNVLNTAAVTCGVGLTGVSTLTVLNGGVMSIDRCVVDGGDASSMFAVQGDLRITGLVVFDPSFNMPAGGELFVEFGGKVPGLVPAGYDKLQVKGSTCVLGGDLDVKLRNGFQPVTSDTFVVLEFIPAGAGIIGSTFSTVTCPFLHNKLSTNNEITIVSNEIYTTAFPGSTTTTTTTTTAPPGSTGSTGRTTGATTTGLASTTSTTGSAPEAASEAESSGAGTTVFIGIGAGALVCCLICIIVVLLIMRKRRSDRGGRHSFDDSVGMQSIHSPGSGTASTDAYAPIDGNSPDGYSMAPPGFSLDTPGKNKHLLDYNEIQFDKEISSGHFGKVWKGTWRDMDVAIKELKNLQCGPEELEEFQAEAEVMAQMPPHQNIVTFIGFCTDPLVICMEFCALGSLDSLLKRHDMSTVAKKLMHDIAKGMNHLTRENLVHKE